MTATLSLVPVEQLTTGAQLFRCVPYSCNMLARSCVTRQAQADSAFPPAHLILCKGCELGAEVKQRASDVEVDPHAAARASRKHMPGVPARKARTELPIVGLELASEPAPMPPQPPAFTTEPKKEEPMPVPMDLTGRDIAGVHVIRQTEKTAKYGGTAWLVRWPCGHEGVVPGTALTAHEKNGGTRRCLECRAGKPAPVATEQAAAPPRAKAPSPSPRKGAKPLPAPSTVKRSPSFQTDNRTYEFPLRRDFAATLTLPTDLNTEDVERLSRFLEALVFEDSVAAE